MSTSLSARGTSAASCSCTAVSSISSKVSCSWIGTVTCQAIAVSSLLFPSAGDDCEPIRVCQGDRPSRASSKARVVVRRYAHLAIDDHGGGADRQGIGHERVQMLGGHAPESVG